MSRLVGIRGWSFVIALSVGLVVVGSNIGRTNKWVASHLLFTYEDGFVRRALIGSLIAAVAPGQEISTALATGLGIAILAVFVIIASFLVSTAMSTHQAKVPVMMAGAILLASGHTKTFAIDVGRFDIILVIASVLCGFAILHSLRLGSMVALVLGTAAVLVHENAVIVVFPLVVSMLVVRRSIDLKQSRDCGADGLSFAFALLGMVVLTGAAVSLPTVAQETVDAAIERSGQRATFAPSASAFSVQSSGLRENLVIMMDFWRDDAFPAAIVLLIALLPAAVIAWSAARSAHLPRVSLALLPPHATIDAPALILAAASSPLLLMIVGVDYGRWTAITVANMAIAALWALSLSSPSLTGADRASPELGRAAPEPGMRPLMLLAVIVAVALPAPTRTRATGLGFESDPTYPFLLMLRGLRDLLGPG